jgi:hypothetical protein
MDAAKSVAEPLNGFMIESMRLVRRCNKPDRKGMRVLSLVSAFLKLERYGKYLYHASKWNISIVLTFLSQVFLLFLETGVHAQSL